LCSQIAPFIGKSVLEVGAGLGSMTRPLCTSQVKSWVLLEPDLEMSGKLALDVKNGKLPSSCKAHPGTLRDLAATQLFDTILYIDVLEHIENDELELQMAMKHLLPGGQLVVLAPAHQFLFSPFDDAVGHYRRYDKKSVVAVCPKEMKMVRARYLDSVGVIASLANRLVLSSEHPTRSQIRFWDRFMIPMSRVIDPLTFHRLGKSILIVWTA
jgi:hypothetical protein